MGAREEHSQRLGMAIDLDRCTGCGACMIACSVENNVSVPPAAVTDRTGLTWIRVYRVDNQQPYPHNDSVFVPVPCQHCDHHTPCQAVCPQTAVDIDPQTGIVSQIPERCLGCRYCMAACPYHARCFNWWDPVWPKGAERLLNPDVSPRMRGVVEKCNFCHGRWQAAREAAAARGERDVSYTPACVESCPTGAITFGKLDDTRGELYRLVHSPRAFRLLEKLGTEPKVTYLSDRAWVRRLAERLPEPGREVHRG